MHMNGGGLKQLAEILSVAFTCVLLQPLTHAGEPDHRPVLAVLAQQCLDCHDASAKDGAIDLRQFKTLADIDRNRPVWKSIFDVVESGQMPLKDSGYVLSPSQREQILTFASQVLARPDASLGAVDPGKPILRRLSRLEYNNTLRDLFDIDIDIFAFPERLPVADKRYFLTARQSMGDAIQTSMREFGQKYDVLLPQYGLPGDNRAEYGYANRGDALNFSPLLMEKYLELARALATSDRLHQKSRVMQELLGAVPTSTSQSEGEPETAPGNIALTRQFPSRDRLGQLSPNDASELDRFITQLVSAFDNGNGGCFDVPASQNNRIVAGKGGLLKLELDSQILTINPNIDLWLAAFSTALESSGDHLLTNRKQGEKVFELTFGGPEPPGLAIEQLALCVLARRNQSGTVRLTAQFADGGRMERVVELSDTTGNRFVSWVAPANSKIVKLAVDGTEFSGDYVLLDDLAFILRKTPRKRTETNKSEPSKAKSSLGAIRVEPITVRPLRERLTRFMSRAFRRPVDDEEIESALSFVAKEQLDGASEQAAVRRWIQAILVSPEFLYRMEPVSQAGGAIRRLEPYELASRLSYFLWSSMPDEALLLAASQNELSTNEGLRRQVRRMLQDRQRSRELSECFAVQWLRLDQLFAAQPDRKLFKQFYSGPQGKSTLHGAMMTEALLLFETTLVENRSCVELFSCGNTWLNQQLADLYGLRAEFNSALEAAQHSGALASDLPQKDLAGTWLRVRLPDQIRGGVITMAGPLTVTSLPFRTSPVKRGAWLLETVFNRPPSEPKVAFVLDEADEDANQQRQASATVRQRFEQHRSHPNCYTCHSRIDPPGFSLEVFDAVGAWQSHDGKQPVDAAGIWNEVSFNGPAEFKSAMLKRKEEVIRGFVEHLLSFALGRKLEHFDMTAVNEIVTDAATQDFRFASIVEGIALSYPFQHVRNK